LIEFEGADTIAAFIAEPMNGTGGIVPPPEGYWRTTRCPHEDEPRGDHDDTASARDRSRYMAIDT
jgi:hypothetical protein